MSVPSLQVRKNQTSPESPISTTDHHFTTKRDEFGTPLIPPVFMSSWVSFFCHQENFSSDLLHQARPDGPRPLCTRTACAHALEGGDLHFRGDPCVILSESRREPPLHFVPSERSQKGVNQVPFNPNNSLEISFYPKISLGSQMICGGLERSGTKAHKSSRQPTIRGLQQPPTSETYTLSAHLDLHKSSMSRHTRGTRSSLHGNMHFHCARNN